MAKSRMQILEAFSSSANRSNSQDPVDVRCTTADAKAMVNTRTIFPLMETKTKKVFKKRADEQKQACERFIVYRTGHVNNSRPRPWLPVVHVTTRASCLEGARGEGGGVGGGVGSGRTTENKVHPVR